MTSDSSPNSARFTHGENQSHNQEVGALVYFDLGTIANIQIILRVSVNNQVPGYDRPTIAGCEANGCKDTVKIEQHKGELADNTERITQTFNHSKTSPKKNTTPGKLETVNE